MRDPRNIVITGASSGIGEALALAYAAPGIYLALTGRDEARLAIVGERCQRQGAVVEITTIPVTDDAALARWMDEVDTRHPVDLVIANAGISGGTAEGLEGADQTRAILRTNVDGVVNTIMPMIAAMTRRRRGQIALMSSLASFRGFQGAPAYCASKAAVRVWGEGLRGELAPHGVEVCVICPGFVVSRMTAANRFPMPLLMPVERAARIIERGLRRSRPRIAFPWRLYAGVWLLAALPQSLADLLLRHAPRKQ